MTMVTGKCERCQRPSDRLRRNRRLGLMTCEVCRAETVRLMIAIWGS